VRWRVLRGFGGVGTPAVVLVLVQPWAHALPAWGVAAPACPCLVCIGACWLCFQHTVHARCGSAPSITHQGAAACWQVHCRLAALAGAVFGMRPACVLLRALSVKLAMLVLSVLAAVQRTFLARAGGSFEAWEPSSAAVH